MQRYTIVSGLIAALFAAPIGVALAQDTGTTSDSFWLPRKERTFEPGFYVGGGVGYFRVDEQDFFGEGDDLDDDQVSFKTYAGGDILPWLGAEAGYVNFGEVGNGSTFEADGWTIAAIAQIPIGNFAPYAKIGHMWWDADIDTTGAVGSSDGNDWFGGLGLRFALTQALDMRVEYERYQLDEADIDMGSLNLQLQF